MLVAHPNPICQSQGPNRSTTWANRAHKATVHAIGEEAHVYALVHVISIMYHTNKHINIVYISIDVNVHM